MILMKLFWWNMKKRLFSWNLSKETHENVTARVLFNSMMQSMMQSTWSLSGSPLIISFLALFPVSCSWWNPVHVYSSERMIVFVCVCVCVHVCLRGSVCVYICVCMCECVLERECVCIYMCMYVWMGVGERECVCMYAWLCVWERECVYICVYVCVHVCSRERMGVYIYVYVCVNACLRGRARGRGNEWIEEKKMSSLDDRSAKNICTNTKNPRKSELERERWAHWMRQERQGYLHTHKVPTTLIFEQTRSTHERVNWREKDELIGW